MTSTLKKLPRALNREEWSERNSELFRIWNKKGFKPFEPFSSAFPDSHLNLKSPKIKKQRTNLHKAAWRHLIDWKYALLTSNENGEAIAKIFCDAFFCRAVVFELVSYVTNSGFSNQTKFPFFHTIQTKHYKSGSRLDQGRVLKEEKIRYKKQAEIRGRVKEIEEITTTVKESLKIAKAKYGFPDNLYKSLVLELKKITRAEASLKQKNEAQFWSGNKLIPSCKPVFKSKSEELFVNVLLFNTKSLLTHCFGMNQNLAHRILASFANLFVPGISDRAIEKRCDSADDIHAEVMFEKTYRFVTSQIEEACGSPGLTELKEWLADRPKVPTF